MQLHDYNLHTKLNKLQHSLAAEANLNDLETVQTSYGREMNFPEVYENMEADMYAFGNKIFLKCQKLPMINVVSNDNKKRATCINQHFIENQRK
jgi:hypothetical protein